MACLLAWAARFALAALTLFKCAALLLAAITLSLRSLAALAAAYRARRTLNAWSLLSLI